MKLFIDGENLRHRLVSVLHQEHLIGDRDDLFSVDIRQLVQNALGEVPESITYYTTRIKQPKFTIPEMLERKITSIQESHRRWIAMLTNQGVAVIKAGNLKVKESNACYHCGRRTMVLQEKGVDVRLASEIVMAAVHDNIQDIVVLSSDADMIPALNIARRGGAHITYVCFEEEQNDALIKVTDRTLTYTRQQIINAFHPGSAKSHQTMFPKLHAPSDKKWQDPEDVSDDKEVGQE
ncbi:MAG TPA: NYN domain-containing protein [Candidatus Saccharimonadales bacterium]|jgi:uncharacterized LabA/DUF88 family protein